MEQIRKEEVLKRVANGLREDLITEKVNSLRIKKEEIDNILELETISFEQKREIIEKVRLLQLFSNEYISYTTAPTRNVAKRLLLSAHMILEIKNQSEFEKGIKELDTALEICKEVVLHPYESTEKKMQKEIYEHEIYRQGGRF